MNRWVFSDRANVAVLTDGSRRWSGIALKAIAPATANARRPYVLSRCRGTVSWWRAADRRCWRATGTQYRLLWAAVLTCEMIHFYNAFCGVEIRCKSPMKQNMKGTCRQQLQLGLLYQDHTQLFRDHTHQSIAVFQRMSLTRHQLTSMYCHMRYNSAILQPKHHRRCDCCLQNIVTCGIFWNHDLFLAI